MTFTTVISKQVNHKIQLSSLHKVQISSCNLQKLLKFYSKVYIEMQMNF